MDSPMSLINLLRSPTPQHVTKSMHPFNQMKACSYASKKTHQLLKRINGVNNRVVCANIEVGDVEDDCSEFIVVGESFFDRQQVG